MFGSTREQSLLGNLKNFAKVKEYKIALKWVRVRLHSVNVQYDPWKVYFTITGKRVDTITITNCLNWSQRWILEQIDW